MIVRRGVIKEGKNPFNHPSTKKGKINALKGEGRNTPGGAPTL